MAFSVSAGLHEASLSEQKKSKNFQNDPMSFTVSESRMTNICIRQKTSAFSLRKKTKLRRCQSTEQLMEQEEQEGRVWHHALRATAQTNELSLLG